MTATEETKGDFWEWIFVEVLKYNNLKRKTYPHYTGHFFLNYFPKFHLPLPSYPHSNNSRTTLYNKRSAITMQVRECSNQNLIVPGRNSTK